MMTNREQVAWTFGYREYLSREVAETIRNMLGAIGAYLDGEQFERLTEWLDLECDEDNNWGILEWEEEDA